MGFGKEEFQRALQRGEIVLHYLPQIALGQSKRVVGVKALARWKHPKLGLILPDGFIASIETLGIADQFDLLIADTALSDLRQLTDQLQKELRLTLRISSASLSNPEFPNLLASLAKKHDVAPECIVAEVSGTGFLGEDRPERRTLQRLRMLNVLICVNDYDRGSVKIEDLRCVSATELKINRILIQNLLEQSHHRTMAQKMILIAHELDIRIAAEGVEKSQQLEFLSREGCDYAQGYQFSRPLPPEVLIGWHQRFQASLQTI